MAKDAKKKKAEKKARVVQKQEKKATQKEKRQSKKSKDDDSDAEDVDLDAILAAYQKQQEQFLKVTETATDPPSPRMPFQNILIETCADEIRYHRILARADSLSE